MSILLCDDENAYGRHIAAWLRSRGDDVEYARTPQEGMAALSRHAFELVITDLLFNSEIDEMNRLLDADPRSLLQGRSFHSGLSLLDKISKSTWQPKVMIWTAGDINRRLHVIDAYENYGIRVISRKSVTDNADTEEPLELAIQAALAERTHIDPLHQMDLETGRLSLADLLFAKPFWASLWRAKACEYMGYEAIAVASGATHRQVREAIGSMRTNLSHLQSNFDDARPAAEAVATFAAVHRAYFLDATVNARFNS